MPITQHHYALSGRRYGSFEDRQDQEVVDGCACVTIDFKYEAVVEIDLKYEAVVEVEVCECVA